jgi:WD40 repeat protein
MRRISPAVLTLLLGCGGQPASPAVPPPTPVLPGVSVYGAAFSPDGKLLLTSYRITNPDPRRALPKRLALWDTATGKKRWAAEPGEDLDPVGFVPGGKAVLLRAADSLQLWDVEQGKLRRRFARLPKGSIDTALLSADGKVAISRHFGRRGVQVWDLGRGALLRETKKKGRAGAGAWVALSPDGSRAISERRDPREPSKSSVIEVWELTTGELARSFPKAELWEGPAAFSPDGKLATANVYDPKTKKAYQVLWEVDSGKEKGRFPLVASAITFTPDGRRLIVGIQTPQTDKSLKVVEIASGRVLLSAPVDSVNIFAFSPDARLAFTGSGGYSPGGGGSTIKLQLRDLTSGKLLRSLSDPVKAWKPSIWHDKP